MKGKANVVCRLNKNENNRTSRLSGNLPKSRKRKNRHNANYIGQ